MNLSGELARSLLEATPDATIIVDAAGVIVFANAQTRQTFGYDPSELLGAPIEKLLPARFREAHAVHRDGFVAEPRSRPMGAGLALYGLHKDGHEFPVEISLSPAHTPTDGLLVVAAIRDATLQKRTEHQLVEANRAKSRFLAAASHDLRQPLQTLNLLNRAARREAADLPRLAMVLEKQQQALDTMSGLLASVLDISKLDSGTVVPEPVECAIDEVLARVVSDFEPQALEKGLRLRYTPCSEAVMTDPELLRRLLANLVSNAIRYTPKGEVHVDCRRDGDRLAIEVRDTGIGIAPDQVDRVFEEFYQIDNGSQRPDGLGLGLSIVRRLAALLGIEVDFTSTPGAGTVFTVRVPLGTQPEQAAVTAPAPAAAAGGVILVIDDEPAVAEATSLLLELEGYDVMTASCEAEALKRVNARRPDLLVSDFHLRGGENGLAVVTAVREAMHEDVPAVFVTGDTARSAIESAALAHVRLLTKPLRGEELLETISDELAGRPVQRSRTMTGQAARR